LMEYIISEEFDQVPVTGFWPAWVHIKSIIKTMRTHFYCIQIALLWVDLLWSFIDKSHFAQ
jgi:hypothetical protein